MPLSIYSGNLLLWQDCWMSAENWGQMAPLHDSSVLCDILSECMGDLEHELCAQPCNKSHTFWIEIQKLSLYIIQKKSFPDEILSEEWEENQSAC